MSSSRASGRLALFALCTLAFCVSLLRSTAVASPLWKQGVQGNFKLVRDADNSEFVEWMSWPSLASRMGVFNRRGGPASLSRRSRKVFSSSVSDSPDQPHRAIMSTVEPMDIFPLDKPVLLFFHQAKCEACKAITTEMKNSAEFELLAQYFHMVSVDHIDELVDYPYPAAGSSDPVGDDLHDTSADLRVSRRGKASGGRNARAVKEDSKEPPLKETAAAKLERMRRELDALEAMNFEGNMDINGDADDDEEKTAKSWMRQYMPQSDYIPRLFFLYPNNGTVANIVNRNADADHLHFYFDISSLINSMREALRIISGIDNIDNL